MTNASRQSGFRTGTKPVTLADLHGCQVAVHILVQDREQLLIGPARFEADADLGNSLRVQIHDADGNFELVVAESKWDGQILPGQAVGCEYLLRLSE